MKGDNEDDGKGGGNSKGGNDGKGEAGAVKGGGKSKGGDDDAMAGKGKMNFPGSAIIVDCPHCGDPITVYTRIQVRHRMFVEPYRDRSSGSPSPAL